MFEFKKTDAGEGYNIIEPPAGIIANIKKRVDLFANEENNVPIDIWVSILVLACLHDPNGSPTILTLVDKLPNPEVLTVRTLRAVYSDLDDISFKTIIEDFMFSISKPKLEELFKIVDEGCYVTKKATDNLKND